MFPESDKRKDPDHYRSNNNKKKHVSIRHTKTMSLIKGTTPQVCTAHQIARSTIHQEHCRASFLHLATM